MATIKDDIMAGASVVLLALLFVPVAVFALAGIIIMEVPKAYSLLVSRYEERFRGK